MPWTGEVEHTKTYRLKVVSPGKGTPEPGKPGRIPGCEEEVSPHGLQNVQGQQSGTSQLRHERAASPAALLPSPCNYKQVQFLVAALLATHLSGQATPCSSSSPSSQHKGCYVNPGHWQRSMSTTMH